jgi:dinuclear metal center YbgI/SA1388 family protein
MVTIQQVIDHLEKIAHPSLQESYDNSGLTTGDPYLPVKGILIALDCTEEVLDEAIASDCNLIITHHPVIFTGLKKLTGKNYTERIIIKAIKNDIALYAMHTNLDNVMHGVNKVLADKIGLKKQRILRPKSQMLKKLVTFCPTEHAERVRQALFEAGAGEIGNYDMCSFNLEGKGTFRGNEFSDPVYGNIGEFTAMEEIRIEVILESYKEERVLEGLRNAHPYEEVSYFLTSLDNTYQGIGSGMIGQLGEPMDAMEFLQKIKTTIHGSCIRHTSIPVQKIETVAICGGSGSFLLNDAIKSKADAFITSDFKYHQFFDAEGKILVADIGHYESEQFTKELIYDSLIRKFTTFAIRLSDLNTNPVNYL